jgi:hypothetical protein
MFRYKNYSEQHDKEVNKGIFPIDPVLEEDQGKLLMESIKMR